MMPVDWRALCERASCDPRVVARRKICFDHAAAVEGRAPPALARCSKSEVKVDEVLGRAAIVPLRMTELTTNAVRTLAEKDP